MEEHNHAIHLTANGDQLKRLVARSTNPSAADATLSVAELCARWRCSALSLRRWRRLGFIRAYKVGPRRIVFRLSEILRAENRSVS